MGEKMTFKKEDVVEANTKILINGAETEANIFAIQTMRVLEEIEKLKKRIDKELNSSMKNNIDDRNAMNWFKSKLDELVRKIK